MKRKINLVGQNTLTVSLPRKWAEKNGIKKGDEIEVEEEGNALILSNEEVKSDTQKECNIQLTSENNTAVRSILGAYYRRGYDILNITYDDEKIYSVVQKATDNLIGFDIVERGKKRCIIKSYLKEDKEELENTLTRMINTIKTCQEIVKEDYKKSKYDRLNELEEYRHSCWKLRDLYMRIITKTGLFGEKSYGFLILIWSLEKVNRNYKRMYRSLKENNLKYDGETYRLYSKLEELLELFFHIINKFDIKSVEELHRLHDAQVADVFKSMPKGGKNNIMLSYILENIRRVQDMASLLITVNE